MRYGLPRSTSPSPERRSRRRTSTFGLPSDTESDLEEPRTDSDSELSSPSSLSSDSFCYESESQVPPPPPRPKREPRSSAEQRHAEDTVAAIRLRTRYHDPYEEWEKQTRKDAFHTARRAQVQTRLETQRRRTQRNTQELQSLATMHAAQLAEVQKQLATLQVRQQVEVNKLVSSWQEQDKTFRGRIEGVIRVEEEKLRAKLEAERKAREEAEKKRKEEEERRKVEEEVKRKEEEQAQRQRETEAAAKHQEEEKERLRRDKLDAEEQGRAQLGMSLAEEDWVHARETLKNLKAGPMKTVKENKPLKSQWSAIRRQITPKIGQLTHDIDSVTRITQQLIDIICPSERLPPDIYFAALSSLAKAILLQAETEVTAEKRSAIPLAMVAARLLGTLEGFPDIFFAKLVQRSGGWPVPSVIPSTDSDGTAWNELERTKAMGYRTNDGQRETLSDHIMRVSGMMRVYFLILAAPVPQPLDKMFQLPRFWTFFARMIGDERLLETAVAAQVLHAALDVGGMEAKFIWGNQWVKMLELLYEGATTGIGGVAGKLVGGQTPEGKAARVRVQLQIERIMGATSSR
ncbi:GLE1-like protein-domain-containing protein [Suillus subalutaceus]|uniref:GLE1-like protein-domain-containing protein n=1 Tax=Suillus subalutaceus TaxID=48586 RepID=UPI001B87815D|nr:GLE1-like protein-domain-containing protein [Suillus subalutaceus]KAG1856347.1 GLE1-like protein-domain-containing protein [Suillus subalutaceus]